MEICTDSGSDSFGPPPSNVMQAMSDSFVSLRSEPLGPTLSNIASIPNDLAILLLEAWARLALIWGMLVLPKAAVCKSMM